MNVFVTGGTGTLGQGVVRQLVAEGHTVHALSRSDANDLKLRELGAEPVRVKLDDLATLEHVLRSTEAVLHLASRIPDLAHISQREAWRETDRIRRDDTRALVDAALKASVRVFVYPSVVFLYPDGGADWLEAETSTPAPAEYLATTLDAEREVARFAASGARGISLRMGGFYGPESSQTADMLRFAERGIAPLFGRDDGFMPMLWIADASSAVVSALKSATSGVYDVTDDEPLTRGEMRGAMAKAVRRSRLWRIPDAFAGLSLGVVADTMTRSQRVSNARFKAVTGWTPQIRDARAGWAKLGATLEVNVVQNRLPAWGVAGLLYLTLTGFLVGFWAQFAPQSFYDAFPGLGFAWVSLDGPFNEHLMRDVGGLNLALAILATAALFAGRRFAALFGLGALAYQLPHMIYHVIHVGALPTTPEQIMQTATLVLATLIPIALLVDGIRPHPSEDGRTMNLERNASSSH
jgi:2-alkyl-3-oxoalkanoate reductase